jgi:hypothetical protein
MTAIIRSESHRQKSINAKGIKRLPATTITLKAAIAVTT